MTVAGDSETIKRYLYNTSRLQINGEANGAIEQFIAEPNLPNVVKKYRTRHLNDLEQECGEKGESGRSGGENVGGDKAGDFTFEMC